MSLFCFASNKKALLNFGYHSNLFDEKYAYYSVFIINKMLRKNFHLFGLIALFLVFPQLLAYPTFDEYCV